MATHFGELQQQYGNEDYVEALVLPRQGLEQKDVIQIPRVSIDATNYRQAFDDAVHTLRVIIDPKTEKQFEISTAFSDADTFNYDVEVSTYNSAISTNPPNCVEFAENAAVHPDKSRAYISSPGNGFSSPLDSQERKHIKATGRFTYEEYDGKTQKTLAIPTVRALNRALQYADIHPDRLSANSAGCSFATALMYDMPEGQITHAYFKGRPNIANHRPLMLGYRMLVKENMLANKRNQAASKDEWALSDEAIEDANKRVQPTVAELDKNYSKLSVVKSIAKLINDGKAYSRGEATSGFSPATHDSLLALDKQGDTKATFHFSSNDQLYATNPAAIDRFIILSGSFGRQQSIVGIVTKGSHADHTHMPSLRWSAEAFAFNK